MPAGHDRFEPNLVDEHLGPLREGLGLSPEALLSLRSASTFLTAYFPGRIS